MAILDNKWILIAVGLLLLGMIIGALIVVVICAIRKRNKVCMSIHHAWICQSKQHHFYNFWLVAQSREVNQTIAHLSNCKFLHNASQN